MTPLDASILLAFALYASVAGLRARRSASRSLEAYFLADRSLSGWKAGISMAATQFAADTPLLVTGLIATAGIFGLWRLWIYAIAFLLMGFLFAASWRRSRVLTDAELSEIRYAARPAAALRATKAIYFGTIFNCTVLAMVLWAAKEIAEPFLIWDQWLPTAVFGVAESVVTWIGVPFARAAASDADLWVRSTNNLLSLGAIVTVTALYSTTGGLRSVVQTDLVQFALMLVGTTAYAVWIVHAVGGLSGLSDELARVYAEGGPAGMTPNQILAFTPSQAKAGGGMVLAVLAVQWLVQMNADGTGYLAQRSMACRSDADARRAAVVFTVAQILLRSLLWLPIGVGLLVLFPADTSQPLAALTADREVSFVRGMMALPPGLRGLMLTAMLAALASTLDTHLNWGASYWTNDLYRRFICEAWLGRRPSQRSLVWVARGSTAFILLIALVIMTQLSSIQMAWQVSLMLGAGMGVPLVLRWLWWRANAWGELAAIAASLVLAPVLLVAVAEEGQRLLLMALASTVVAVAASILAGPEPRDHLRAFYERARPPGFWGPIAGDDRGRDLRRLGRGLAATALAALSILALLVGLGSWLVGGPAPVGWSGARGLWISLLLVLGLGLVPIWRRLGLSSDGDA